MLFVFKAVVGANVDSTVEADFMTHGCNRSSNDNVSTGASGRITRASRRSSTGDASTATSGPKTTHASRRLSSGDAAAATTSGPMTRARAALPTVDAIAVAETSSLTNRLSESPPRRRQSNSHSHQISQVQNSNSSLKILKSWPSRWVQHNRVRFV